MELKKVEQDSDKLNQKVKSIIDNGFFGLEEIIKKARGGGYMNEIIRKDDREAVLKGMNKVLTKLENNGT
jgi:hypothetical protein